MSGCDVSSGPASDLVTRCRDWRAETERVHAEARRFAELAPAFPFANTNGMAPDTAFYLYFWLRELAPSFVVESGFWRGFSTWVIEHAVPEAKVVALDPIFALQHCLDNARIGQTYRSPRVNYSGMDFSCCGFEFMEKPASSLVLFDDHQNKINRLVLAAQKGFRHLIFDDNLPGQATHITFFEYLSIPSLRDWLMEAIEIYEIFPPLWDTMAGMRNETFVPGLNIPREASLAVLDTTAAPRSGYSWLTYVRLREDFVAAAQRGLTSLPRLA